MKKALCFLLLTLAVYTKVNAGNASLFELDQNIIQSELTDLSNLENYVQSHEGVTLAELMGSTELVKQFALNSIPNRPFAPMFSFEDMDWIGFIWGFCCWPVGVIIYFVNDKDKNYIISVVIGFLVAAVIDAIAYRGYYARI